MDESGFDPSPEGDAAIPDAYTENPSNGATRFFEYPF
jgi:hypothetical protein